MAWKPKFQIVWLSVIILLNTVCAGDTKLEGAINTLDDRNKDKVLFVKACTKKPNCIATIKEQKWKKYHRTQLTDLNEETASKNLLILETVSRSHR